MVQQVLAVCVALFLLFADSGQLLYAHTCHHSNSTTFSVNDVKVCCGSCASEELAETIAPTGCCDIQTQWLKQNYVTDTQGQAALQVDAPSFSLIGQAYLTRLSHPRQAVPLAAQGHSPPLPLPSWDIRLTQSLRI